MIEVTAYLGSERPGLVGFHVLDLAVLVLDEAEAGVEGEAVSIAVTLPLVEVAAGEDRGVTNHLYLPWHDLLHVVDDLARKI